MFRSCRYVLTGLVAAVALNPVPVALAQGLEIAPIGFDVADQGDDLVLAAFAPDAAPVFDGVRTGTAPAAARVSAGLPRPSIILGLITPGQEEDFGLENLLPATVEQFAFALDDLAAREALRESDPILFERLVNEGHLDPDAGALPTVLQTELARMNCYRAGIDGLWGPGSRRSVGEYFDQLASVEWPDQAPTFELFRAIILNGDVACSAPQPVAAAPARATPTRTTQSRPATTQARPAAPAPKPAAPAAKPRRTLSGSSLGIGALR